MWMEVKALFTVAGCFIFGILIAFTGNLIFALLGIVAMFTLIAGDIMIGLKLISTDAINLLDPNKPGERTVDLHLIGGGRRIIKGKKGALGKIEFVYQKKKTSVIDDGSYPIRFSNGNQGVVAHESYDKNINLYKDELLKKLFNEHKVDNVKDLYIALKKQEGNNE